jgi:hypothetical protein
MKEGRFGQVWLSGDFFCFPREAIGQIERVIEGCRVEALESLLKGFYSENEIETPGIGIEDWLKVLSETT